MPREILTLGLGVGVILLTTQALHAQDTGCAGRLQMVEHFASPETGSWTILVTTPNGIACLFAAGDSFERVDAPLPGDPA